MIEEKLSTIYVTQDGREFMSKDLAKRHEAKLFFREWYEDEKLYGNSEGCRIDAEDMLEWLLAHEAKLRLLFGC